MSTPSKKRVNCDFFQIHTKYLKKNKIMKLTKRLFLVLAISLIYSVYKLCLISHTWLLRFRTDSWRGGLTTVALPTADVIRLHPSRTLAHLYASTSFSDAQVTIWCQGIYSRNTVWKKNPINQERNWHRLIMYAFSCLQKYVRKITS